MPESDKEIMEEITLKMRAVIREAREAYNASYGYAKVALAIPEIAEGLKLYLRRRRDARTNNEHN